MKKGGKENLVNFPERFDNSILFQKYLINIHSYSTDTNR